MTDTPALVTYSSVVSRDSVRLAFLIAGLNDLDILAGDVGNAYLNAPCREKIWFEAGAECGEQQGMAMIIERALYGLKSSGAAWRAMLSKTVELEMRFVPSRADPDVYIKAATKPDGFQYYEMILIYVDNILIVSHDPRPHMDYLRSKYVMKDESVGSPETYLGAQTEKDQLPDGMTCWHMSARKYLTQAVKNVRQMVKDDHAANGFSTKANTPIPTNYRPELDMTPELGPELASRYMQLIGILRWATEIGRLDILLETALLSQYMAMPRRGHLNAVYHVFAYLAKNDSYRIAFDPRQVIVDKSAFEREANWIDFYGEVPISARIQ